jgi:glucose-6-phosphate dehydrogenase assembly protein OpcA
MTSAAAAADMAFKPVDPGAIEKELQALWCNRAEISQRAAPDERPQSRTLLHTLVVYAPDAVSAAQAQSVIAAISPHQPGRMILLVVQPEGQSQPDFQAGVRLHCEAPESGRDPVCCEQIVLTASGPAAARRLPGAVLPLLVTDVPSFLYWSKGNPFRSPILKDLAPAIDRLIVDSFTFAAPDLDLGDVATAIDNPRSQVIISDLSWARLAVWRHQTAQIFDPANMRPYLKRVRRARLRYYAGTPILAWIFGGWLASRLGWKCVERNPQGAQYFGGQVLDYEMLPAPEPGLAGYFAGVSMTADDGATFEVARKGSNFAATVIEMGDMKFERVVPLKDETTTEWLGHELGRLSATPTYNAALGQLVEVARSDEAYAG